MEKNEPEKIRLSFYQCPGDTIVATGAVECLVKQFPDKYLIDVEGTDAKHIFENNPHIKKLDGEVRSIRMENILINDSDKRPIHFLDSYVQQFKNALGIDLYCSVNRPYLYVSSLEKTWTPQVHQITGKPTKYWVVCSGWKNDYTVKNYGYDNYQEVINKLKGKIQFVQVGKPEHNHMPLHGAINLVGATDTRQLIRLCYHAQGGLGAESFLHHIFAALQKPFVCLTSGFLPRSWISYPTTTVLSKAAMMPCAKNKGCCWRSRVVKLNDGDEKDSSLCELPVLGGTEPVAKCLEMIRPEEVITTIQAYYESGLLTY